MSQLPFAAPGSEQEEIASPRSQRGPTASSPQTHLEQPSPQLVSAPISSAHGDYPHLCAVRLAEREQQLEQHRRYLQHRRDQQRQRLQGQLHHIYSDQIEEVSDSPSVDSEVADEIGRSPAYNAGEDAVARAATLMSSGPQQTADAEHVPIPFVSLLQRPSSDAVEPVVRRTESPPPPPPAMNPRVVGMFELMAEKDLRVERYEAMLGGAKPHEDWTLRSQVTAATDATSPLYHSVKEALGYEEKGRYAMLHEGAWVGSEPRPVLRRNGRFDYEG